MKQQPITAFTFTYREVAKANIAPIQTIKCEGMQASNGTVILQTPDKSWHSYNDMEEMCNDFSKHGKGTIRIVASEKSEVRGE